MTFTSSLKESRFKAELVYSCKSVEVLILLGKKANFFLNWKFCFSVLLFVLLGFIIQCSLKVDVDAVLRCNC